MFFKLKQKIQRIIPRITPDRIIIIFCLLVIAFTYWHMNDKNEYKINIITEAGSIIFSIIVIEILWKQREEKKKEEECQRKEEENKAIQAIGFNNFYYISMFFYRQTLINIFGEDKIKNNNVQFIEIVKLFEPYHTVCSFCNNNLAYHFYFKKLLALYNDSKTILVGLNLSLAGKRDDLINEVENFVIHNMHITDLYEELQNREICKSPEHSESMLKIDKKLIQDQHITQDLDIASLEEGLKEYARIYPEIFRTLKYNINFINRYNKIIDEVVKTYQHLSI